MASILQNILAALATRIVSKYKPKIIGITGSVGKTSSRNAIFLAVSGQYRTRQTEKNYNNELGVPLTIIGGHAPGRNPVAWLGLLFKALTYWLLPREYPEVLVLEMGVDHPGDMDYLLSIAKPDIGVLTFVGSAHYEFFGSLQAVAEEKAKLIKSVPEHGYVIVNTDNEIVAEVSKSLTGNLISYGKKDNANVKLISSSIDYSSGISTTLVVQTPDNEYQLTIPVFGDSHIYAVLSAIAVATSMGIHRDVILAGLRNYKPVAGRLSVFAGLKRSVVIDDSYNASPDSVKVALRTISEFPQPQKMLVLGDMLELGESAIESHKQVGRLVAELNPQYLITAGKLARVIAEEAILKGLPADKCFSYVDPSEAAKKALQLLDEDLVILVKGSQGARMEKVSKEIMAEPMRASELLPRQYGKWLED